MIILKIKNTTILKRTFKLFLLALSFSFLASAQDKIEVKGIILDETKYPVPYVAVGIVKKYIGTASTEDGEFSFFITKNELQDSLSISSLGFDPFKVKVADFLKQEKQEIILKETITELNAITLLKPSDYILNALKSLRDNTISTPHKIEILYRGAASENGKSKFFVENYIKIKDRGPAYPLGTIEVAEARKSADYRYWKRTQWRHSIVGAFEVNPLRPGNSQHSRNLKKFKWSKIGDSSYEGEDVVILEGKNPKKAWEKMKFYIGIDSYKVYRIERGNSLYIYKKHKTGKMVLSYTKGEWRFPKDKIPKQYLGTPGETLEYKREGFVLNVETNKKKIKVKPFGVEKDMGSIELPYNPVFWQNLNMPPDTKFFKKIKKQLEGNYGVPLEKQFELVNK
ncbi:hypothetical protein GCM10022291_03400 [Postechiella marina]|uniref:Carboxypeptidase-like regulatory domain-containing protein n=1 Tax=Postechiella marina TaxID=943941 RepID=A0ABP8BZX4_9FLAO